MCATSRSRSVSRSQPVIERHLNALAEHGVVVLGSCIACSALLQPVTAELDQYFAHHRLHRAQQVELLGLEVLRTHALEQTDGDLAAAVEIDDVVAVFRATDFQVVNLVVLAAEKVVRGNFGEVIKPSARPPSTARQNGSSR